MKKNFTDNPAFEMITQSATATATAEAPAKKAAKAKPAFAPEKRETKSKKLLLLLKPSLFDRIQTKAEQYSLSTNELINQILEQTV